MINKLFLVIGFLILSITHLSAATPAQVGTPLNASNGTWSGNPTSWTYQWNHCATPPNSNCTAIPANSTSQSYTPVTGDIGDTITVAVTAHNTVGASLPSISVATAVVTAASGICLGVHDPNVNGFDPNAPNLSGYNLVFDSEFNNFNDFDLSCDGGAHGLGTCANPPPAGKNWYGSTWSFNTASKSGLDYNLEAAPYPVANNKQVLHMHETRNGNPYQTVGGWTLSTMTTQNANGISHGPANWQNNWQGKLFTGGWYVEARISTEYAFGCCGFVQGHVTIWSFGADNHLNGQGEFAEDDLIDGLTGNGSFLTGILDWEGGGNVDVNFNDGCISSGSHNVTYSNCGFAPDFSNRGQAHIIGQLWVPATNTSQGYVQMFFDGKSMGFERWNKCGGLNCNRDGSVMDFTHLQVQIGNDPVYSSSPGQPLTTSWWDWVHIWQLPAAANTSGNATVTPQANFAGGNGSCNANK